jgi:DNA-binding CsgD family transcriptional regulator
MDRKITEFQELVFRLRHHEHFGRSTKETAAILETSPSSIRNALTVVRRVAPGLFPILSREDWKVWCLWIEYKRTARQIAEILSLPYETVRSKLRRIKKKLGVRVYGLREQPDARYKESMDKYVRIKF